MKKISNIPIFLASIAVIGAISWCWDVIKQKKTQTEWILENSEVKIDTQFIVYLNKKELNLDFKRWHLVFVMYIDEKWNKTIAQEEFSERHAELNFYSYNKVDINKITWSPIIVKGKICVIYKVKDKLDDWETYDPEQIMALDKQIKLI